MAHGLSVVMRGITTPEQRMIQRWQEMVAKRIGTPVGHKGSSKGFYSPERYQKRSQAKHRKIERQTGIR